MRPVSEPYYVHVVRNPSYFYNQRWPLASFGRLHSSSLFSLLLFLSSCFLLLPSSLCSHKRKKLKSDRSVLFHSTFKKKNDPNIHTVWCLFQRKTRHKTAYRKTLFFSLSPAEGGLMVNGVHLFRLLGNGLICHIQAVRPHRRGTPEVQGFR